MLRALELVTCYAPRDGPTPGDAVPSGPRAQLAARRAAPVGVAGPHGPAGHAAGLDDTLVELADEALRSAYQSQAGGVADAHLLPTSRRRQRELVEAASLAVSERLEAPQPGRAGGRAAVRPSTCRAPSTAWLGSARAATRADSARAPRLSAWCAERAISRSRPSTFGYADHSHDFTNSFRRELGLPPSRFRALVGAPVRATPEGAEEG